MNLNDYQDAALTTAIYPPDRAADYLFPALLLEALELQENPSVDEAGDVLWMTAALMHLYGIKMGDVDYRGLSFAPHIHSIVAASQVLLTWHVKGIRAGEHNIPFGGGELLTCILADLQQLAIELGTNLKTVAQVNLTKLADRKARGVIGGNGDHR